MDYEQEIAKAGLQIKAVKLRPENPFTWASGYRMPIYNDNKMFLWRPEHRELISDGFIRLMEDEGIYYCKRDFIAGTSTAGIPHGERLADVLYESFIYVRDKPKDHGLKNQIEGIDAESDLSGKSGILIEDLISTGESSARAVQAIRDANGECDYCFAIFDYGLDKAVQVFQALNPECNVRALLNFETLLRTAKEAGYVNERQVKILEEWRDDPFTWGEKHGFPNVER